MNCQKCNRPNRPSARFCKWCGEALTTIVGKCASAQSAPLDALIDKTEIKSRLDDIVNKAKAKTEFCRRNNISARMQLSFVITGEAGTGKTTVAQTIAAALAAAGVLKSPVAETVNPVDYDNWVKNIDKHAQRLANSALIIEEAQKLVPDGEAEEVAKLDHVLQMVRKWREDDTKPVVIITGGKRLANFFAENPNSAAVINFFLKTEEISIDGLMEIALRQLSEKYHRTLTEDAAEKLRRIFVYDRRNLSEALGAGGHDAAARAYGIDLAALDAPAGPLGPEYVKGKEFKPKTLQEVMNEFDKYVGVDEVKAEVRTVANNIEQDVKSGLQPQITHHYQFLGNPGTGKTTMARLFADVLNALGALPVGHLVEVTKDDLVSSYVGDTTSKVVSVCQKAMGGVLFIDEAYQLGNDDHGKDAIDTLLTQAENNRGKLVVIIAGYTKEMGEFVQLNSGLSSRFDKIINFRDYKPEELTEIFRRLVASSKEGLQLDNEAEELVGNVFKKMYLTRTRTFGNAREVRTVFNRAVENMKNRLASDPASGHFLTMKDIEGEEGKTKSVDEILAEFDDMKGMEQVKSQIRSIARSVELNRRRAQTGRGQSKVQNIHIAITGSPGTGKTEIAKRLGRIFKAMGVLPKGHVVERERKTLLDSMANSAGVNMDKAVDEAMGGVLFIDEAYNLIPMNNPSDKDKDGTAAIEALMTRMSNDAGKFITVIAGYKAEIEEFIANANPGLARRFTHRIHIDDYSADVLVEIYKGLATKDNFTLTPEAEELLQKKVQEMVTMKDKNFGNAGAMVKLYAETIERQGDRLGESMDELTEDQMFTIEAADIPYESPKRVDIKQCMRDLDSLVGLESVKKMVRELADTITIEQERAAAEGRQPHYPMSHYLFLGNPGTGKTTVARIMGDIFYTLGLLPSNKLVEVKPADMISGYVGQTAPLTRKMIDRGLGGVLFIDEAYGLNDGQFGTRDATPEMLTLLNDYKGRMVCIAAGYPREMTQWLATNTGFDRRFETKVFFEDYSADELATIFMNILKKEGMRTDEAAENEMRRYFEALVYNKGDNFGNAAEAVKYFNKVKINQGARLRKLGSYNREELYWLRREDMIME